MNSNKTEKIEKWDWPTKTKLISRDDINKVLNMSLCIDIVEKTYKYHGTEQVVMPSKITLDTGEFPGVWPEYGGSYNAMPAYIGGNLDISGIKWVWGFDTNYLRGIPYIGATILLNEAHSGEPLAVMDGTLITEMRTGASAGVAAKYLARKDTKIVGVIGAGTEGRMNCRAMASIFGKQLEEIRINDIKEEVALKAAAEMTKELGVPIRATSLKEACIDSDIISTVTTADEPLVKKEWLKKGCTVLSLGSYQELEESIILDADKLVVDSWEQNTHRGELVKLYQDNRITDDNLYATMYDLAAGKTQGRENNDEIICACIIGLGSTDISTAGYLFKNYFDKDDSLSTFIFRK